MSIRRLHLTTVLGGRGVSGHIRRVATSAVGSGRRHGVVREWHPFERRGVIVEDGTGTTFSIPNTRAFETVLPTNLRALVGAKVTFAVADEARQAAVSTNASPARGASNEGEYRDIGTDRVVIRRRSDDIHSTTFRRPPPKIDLLAAFRVPVAGAGAEQLDTSTASAPLSAPPKVDEPAEALDDGDRLPWQRKRSNKPAAATAAPAAPTPAFDILIDMNTVPLPSQERQREDAERTYLREGVAPASHLKDLRSTTLLNETQLNRLRQLSGMKAMESTAGSEYIKGISQEPGVPSTNVAAAAESSTVAAHQQATGGALKEPSKKVVTVNRDPAEHVGTIVAWSSIHRTGLVLLGELQEGAPIPVVKSSQTKGVYVIRNVEAFQSAMPSSLTLVGRRVVFVGVRYSDLPQQTFAEEIVIKGELDYTMTVSPEVQEDSKEAQKAAKKRKVQSLILDPTQQERERLMDDPDAWYRDNIPTGAVYGVLTRWSGGQGSIEIGSGRTYFVESAVEFLQLIDGTASQIRGAVVTFEVNADTPRFARRINVLTLSVKSDAETPSKPLVMRKPDASANSEADAGDVASTSVPPEGSVWLKGFLASWSPQEDQGIIQCDDGNRYLLRDASENIKDFKERAVHLIKKGRRVSFVRMSNTGLVATHVMVEDEEADEETLRKASLDAEQKEPLRNMDGNMDEAVASPLSTGYWMSKLEKVGFDVSEVKKRQESVIPPDLLEDDDDTMLDTKEVLSKDRWFNDKEKNKKLPGSDVRPGDIAQISPTAMVNLAGKIRNPAKLEKMKDKYYNQLSEEMKEHAWKQAKEMAPRYGKRMRDARDKGEEPTFHFY